MMTYQPVDVVNQQELTASVTTFHFSYLARGNGKQLREIVTSFGVRMTPVVILGHG